MPDTGSDELETGTWADFAAFASEHTRRAESLRVPVAEAVDTTGGDRNGDDLRILWLPETGEVIEEHSEHPKHIRLLGRVPHRDYLEDALAKFDGHTISVARRLAWWESLMCHPEEHHDPAEEIPDYGHRRRHVDQVTRSGQVWDLDLYVDELRQKTEVILDRLSGDFNLAAAVCELRQHADNVAGLRDRLAGAYAVAHQRFPGQQEPPS